MLIALSVPAQAGSAEKTLRIGSATLGSAGYIHWEACAFLTNKYSKVKASSMSTSGSTESVFLLERKAIDVGHGSSLEVVNANEGLPPFKKKYKIWQVFCLERGRSALNHQGRPQGHKQLRRPGRQARVPGQKGRRRRIAARRRAQVPGHLQQDEPGLPRLPGCI